MTADHGSPLKLPLVPERRNIRDHVAHALRAALIAGELRPGLVYSAPALAGQFGVSPTPVREAMLDLAKEGMVEPVRNKGFRITAVSERDLDEYTEIRRLIEVPLMGRIARAAPRAELEALRPVAARIVEAARAGDLIGYLEHDRRFHLSLLTLAGNERLVEVVGDLRKRSRLYGLTGLAERGVLVASAEEHERLLDLLLAGDAEGAEACMGAHLGHVRTLWAEGRAADGDVEGGAEGSVDVDGGRGSGGGARR
ncbi:GntR family transcriptional regulator [Streptomyces sp. NPDC002055]|uniref:GntR family transcriptional regulator n=1 Tax=Streptomyces sp. NPDC002055 TaxID=3154534 RepID=UPI0033344247